MEQNRMIKLEKKVPPFDDENCELSGAEFVFVQYVV